MLDRVKATLLLPIATLLLVLPLLLNSCNPFAPRLEEIVLDRDKVLGNPKTIKGFFEWFKNSYELRDTLLFGQMLAPDFRFTFIDFNNNVENYWDREVEMRSAYSMFRQVKSTSLQWNNYVYADTLISDTAASVERYFNLIIVQDDQTIFRGTGSARLHLIRKNSNESWRIRSWFDKSDF
jgi:hypothetical protein